MTTDPAATYRAAATELRRLLTTVPEEAAQAMAAAAYSLDHAAAQAGRLADYDILAQGVVG